LSRDQVLDANDRQLGYAEHRGLLESDQGYAESATVELPRGISGPYYIFVRVDVHKALKEAILSNNTAVASGAVTVEIPAPSDLVVESVAVPATGVPGQQIKIDWSVHNASANAARGSWTD